MLVARVALHYLPDYKQELTQYLSSKLEIKVEFDAISSQWEGFDPVLRVHGLTIGEQDQLTIGRISLNFSSIQSLLNLQAKFDRVLVEQTAMSLMQGHDGHWEFLGFNSSKLQATADYKGTTSTAISKVLSFFNGTTINLQELSASIFNDMGELRALRAPTLNVNYKDEQLFASGQLLESHGDKTLLNFSLKGSGLFTTHKLKGTVFSEARSSELFGELLSKYDWEKISIQNIEASGRAWLSFDGFNISSIYGDLQVREMEWTVADDFLAPIKNLAFTYFWQSDGEEKKLSIENFAFEWSGFKCEPANAKVSFTDSEIHLQANKAELHCINELMLSLDILPEKLHQRLATSKPRGYLSNIHFHQFNELDQTSNSDSETSLSESSKDKRSNFEFEAMLSDVSVEAYGSTPSGKNLDGYVFSTNDSGFVSFFSEDFELGFPTLFLEPWALRRAEGLISWNMHQDEVIISSDGLRLWRDADSLVYGDFILRLNDEETEDQISLAIGLQNILFPEVVKFVPYHLVKSGLYSWLTDSLVAGTVSSGVYYGYGSVDSVSAVNSFTSSVYLKSNNGVLMFDKEWPYLENLNADIVIQNSQVWIDSKQASISGTTLNDVKAYLPEGKPNKANFIDISANSLLTKELIEYWLTESPISNNTQEIAQQLTIDNSAQININLKVPVSQADDSDQKQDIGYLVTAKIVDGAITHKPSKLKFTAVNGLVNVDSTTGVAAKSIKASLFNEPVSLSIKTDYRANASKNNSQTDQITQLFMEGGVGLGSIFNYFDAAKPDFINGKLSYVAELTLSSDDNQYPLLTIRSDLKGTDCQCPKPFDKHLGETQALILSLLLKPEQSYLEGSLIPERGPKIAAELLFVKSALIFGEFLIGEAHVKNTDIKGINIAANLESAELSAWLDFIQKALGKKSADIPIPTKEGLNENNSLVKQIQLDINELNAFGHLFEQSSLIIQPLEKAWKIDIEGKDAIGSVLIAAEDEDEKLNLQFEKLNLIQLASAEEPKQPEVENAEADLDPRDFPRLSFNAKNLLLDNRPVGNWQFDLAPDESGSVFRNIKGHIKGSNITGQLNWRYNAGVQNTIATISLNGENISSVLNAFDLPALMTSARYTTEMALVWPESPLNFSLAELSGNISIALEDGFLKTEDQKTGVLRLFGILNAESIKRRLKLDFSDLYKSGIGYDTFVAKAVMDQGLLSLTEPLIIDGPAGKYTLNGRSDLATKVLDIDMLVELPFSQNVPLAALVLGAPQIGGLVWVADKLLGEPLSALTTSRYDITGTWDKPRVDLKQAMNASKKDRTKEKGTRNVGKP